LNDNHNSVTYP